jgi:prepilin-type N-terminal cleavage/methylation domain-containing protein
MKRQATSAIRRRLRGQRGFTLIELMVGMAAGIVVISALFTIVDITFHQTTKTFSRIDATQRARAAMEVVENEMHSACIENSVVPIVAGSTPATVIFYSQYGNAITVTPIQHRLAFNSGAGTLTDTTYPVTGGSPNTWAGDTANPIASKTLLTNVSQSGSTPVFQYYYFDASGQHAVASNPLNIPDAARTVQVDINLVVGPGGGSNEDTSQEANTVSNSILLRVTPFPNPGQTNQDFMPCG